MATQQRKRNIKSIDLNDYLMERTQKLVDIGKFNTPSDVIVTALIEFLTRQEFEKENNTAIDILLKMLETPEGKAAFEKVTKEKQESTKSNIENPTKDIVLRRKVVFD